MAQPDFPPALSLRASRTFAARRETVFRAWTTAEAIRRWFIEPSDGRWTEEPLLDPRPGGQYRFAGESAGKPWCVHGTYREVRPPERLVFTWEWDDHPNPGDSGRTLVTVDFVDRDEHDRVDPDPGGIPARGLARRPLDGLERMLRFDGAAAFGGRRRRVMRKTGWTGRCC